VARKVDLIDQFILFFKFKKKIIKNKNYLVINFLELQKKIRLGVAQR
jgi:hypothetical protein